MDDDTNGTPAAPDPNDPGDDPPPPDGDGDGGGGDGEPPPNANKIILGRLALLYLHFNQVVNHMSRTSSLTMKTVIMGSFIVSAVGLNKPSATIIRAFRHLLNEISRLLGGAKLDESLVMDAIITLGEQYGLYYFFLWGVESALCLENGDCENFYLNEIQVMKIVTCGPESDRMGVIQSNRTYCHLAFNCAPFIALLLAVILLYILVEIFGYEDDQPGPRPHRPPHPPGNVKTKPRGPNPNSQLSQPIATSCPHCKQGSTTPYPRPAPVVCTDCEPKPPPDSTSKPTTPTPGPSTKKPKQKPKPTPSTNTRNTRHGYSFWGDTPVAPTPGPSRTLAPSATAPRGNPVPSLNDLTDFEGLRLFTNLRIPVSSLSPHICEINALSNISNQDILASAIYGDMASALAGGRRGGDCGGGGGGNNDDDDPTECPDLPEECLAHLRVTIQNAVREMFAEGCTRLCLQCHDRFAATGLCSCTNCGRFHDQDDNPSGSS